MNCDSTPLGSIARRTRGQWDNFYRDWHNETKKKKNQETLGTDEEQGSRKRVSIPENDLISLTEKRAYEGKNLGENRGVRGRGRPREQPLTKNVSPHDLGKSMGSNDLMNSKGSYTDDDSDDLVVLDSDSTSSDDVGVGNDDTSDEAKRILNGKNRGVRSRGRPRKQSLDLDKSKNVSPHDLGESTAVNDSMNSKGSSPDDDSDDLVVLDSDSTSLMDDDVGDDTTDEENNVVVNSWSFSDDSSETSKDENSRKRCKTKSDSVKLRKADGVSKTEKSKSSRKKGGGRKKGAWGKKKTSRATNDDHIRTLVDCIEKVANGDSDDLADDVQPLPLKFRFVDEEEEPPPEKTEQEKEIDALFNDLNMGLMESEPQDDPTTVGDDNDDDEEEEDKDINAEDIDTSLEACCSRGEHTLILDEQIGIKCIHCSKVLLEIEDILPDFYTPPPGRYFKRDWREPQRTFFDKSQFYDSTAYENPSSPSFHAVETVWDLIRGVKSKLYSHQQEGFEFMWRNIAGDIFVDKLKRPLSGDGKGCIISHAPGTGKTRLSIVFLQSFMKFYPTCRPVIIAPRGMLLTWEEEFRKWEVKTPFHNLNTKELSTEQNAISSKIIGSRKKSSDCIRLVKLYSWVKGGSILGISYNLFEKLTGEHQERGQSDQIRNILLKKPGLLVLDEGHTPRNDQSLMWKALTNVATNRRIILSGTPFQNNFEELYNTLYLVNPKFADQIGGLHCKRGRPKKNDARGNWTSLTKSIRNTTDGGLARLRKMIDPLVHVHKGTILQQSLPGMRDSVVFLQPTGFQKSLLETASKEPNFLHKVRVVSLISVHPSLVTGEIKFSAHQRRLKEIESKIDEGVKMKFVTKLIQLANARGERVLIFSQFLDNLVFIKQQLNSQFNWKEGREVLYMNGKLDENQRQSSINSFNDESSEAKVLLASEKACSEGINLIGASRVVLLDSVWNPSVERQAISRAYRLGQKRVVYVYHLITSETMELRKYVSQAEKDHISQLIFSDADGLSCHSETSKVVGDDKLLDQLVEDQTFKNVVDKIIHQPKASELIDIFGYGGIQL